MFKVKLNWNKRVTKLYIKIDYSASKQFNTLLLAGNVLRVFFYEEFANFGLEEEEKPRVLFTGIATDESY